MTRLDALKALAEKVEAGGWSGGINGTARQVFPYHSSSYEDHGLKAAEAFDGSLDAAKALHEAVLPGWGWEIEREEGKHPLAWCLHHHYDAEFVRLPDPARAWLLAILRALISQEEAKG